jgi:hypothetical protein
MATKLGELTQLGVISRGVRVRYLGDERFASKAA